MFQEFPKALYKDGQEGGELAVVQDAEQEAAKRAEGFAMIGDGAQIASPEPEPPADEPPAETVESVRAKLDAAGIKYDKRTRDVAKLQALLG